MENWNFQHFEDCERTTNAHTGRVYCFFIFVSHTLMTVLFSLAPTRADSLLHSNTHTRPFHSSLTKSTKKERESSLTNKKQNTHLPHQKPWHYLLSSLHHLSPAPEPETTPPPQRLKLKTKLVRRTCSYRFQVSQIKQVIASMYVIHIQFDTLLHRTRVHISFCVIII